MTTRTHPVILRLAILFFLWGSASAIAWDLAGLDPATMGMGGAGVAWGGRAGASSNPALLALTDSRAEILMEIAQVAKQSDRQTTFRDALNGLQSSTRVFQQTQSEVDKLTLIESMGTLSSASRSKQLSGGGNITFPNLPIALGAYVNGYYNELLSAEFANTQNVSVSVNRRAVAVIDSGAIFAGTLGGDAGRSRTTIGIAPKLLSVRTYLGTTPAESADLNSIPAQTHNFGKANLDLGFVQELGFDWTVGARIRNAVPFSITANQTENVVFHSRPSLRVGVAHRVQRWTWALDSDVNDNGGFNWQARQRNVSVGAQYRANDWLNIRGGAFSDVAGRTGENSGVAGGLGVVTEYVNADAAAMWSRRDWVVAARISVAF